MQARSPFLTHFLNGWVAGLRIIVEAPGANVLRGKMILPIRMKLEMQSFYTRSRNRHALWNIGFFVSCAVWVAGE